MFIYHKSTRWSKFVNWKMSEYTTLSSSSIILGNKTGIEDEILCYMAAIEDAESQNVETYDTVRTINCGCYLKEIVSWQFNYKKLQIKCLFIFTNNHKWPRILYSKQPASLLKLQIG